MYDEIAFQEEDGPRPLQFEEPEASTTKVSKGSPRVLIVDDERLIVDTLKAILNDHGFEAYGAYSGEEAIEAVRRDAPDVVLSDVLMPRMSGIEFAIKIRKEFPRMSIFLFSGQAATTELMRKARAEGYQFELLPKPIHPEELIARLRGRR